MHRAGWRDVKTGTVYLETQDIASLRGDGVHVVYLRLLFSQGGTLGAWEVAALAGGDGAVLV